MKNQRPASASGWLPAAGGGGGDGGDGGAQVARLEGLLAACRAELAAAQRAAEPVKAKGEVRGIERGPRIERGTFTLRMPAS